MTTIAWPHRASHRAWLAAHGAHLLDFGLAAGAPGGGGYWLHDDGTPWPDKGLHTWITSRTAHVFGLGAMLGHPGARPVAQRALDGLCLGGSLHDDEHGGWFAAVPAPGGATDVLDQDKAAYAHAFVVLAAATGVRAGLDGAAALLRGATETLVERFWDEEAGLLADTWDRGFTTLDPYRGINANMHGVEAMLSAADVTGDPVWLQRAARIGRFVVAQASAHDWRLPEHYDADWQPELELNADRKDDPFKPYGATVGHGLEWARLLLHIDAGERAGGAGAVSADWLGAARALYDRAVADGWAADGADGFVYTTDWSGTPVVRTRMHWVAAEAVNTAYALHECTGEDRYAEDYARWWDYCATHLLDRVGGSWHHELAPDNSPSDAVWPGRADLYHAYQATLIPRLPLTPAMATAVPAGLLE